MSIPRTVEPSQRPLTPPGEILLEEFIRPLELTQRQVADAIDVSFQRLNGIVRGRRAVTSSTALRLASYFGTTPQLWLNLQQAVDLHEARTKEAAALARIEPLRGLSGV